MQIGVDTARAVENKRVFVVDSNDVTGMALQFMLADEMECNVYEDVQTALDWAENRPPQVILLGEALLLSDGVDIVGKFKAAIPEVRILLVTADAAAEHVKAGIAAGAASSIVKPLTVEAVRRKVDAQLGRRAALSIPVAQG
ncbi:response regulator [Derxia lacustris]|uniref:response regulator n=1 Tax=Derxia lacustris TaxID=764842 RepID=UPI000A175AC5|nr:response regulator [Derxia lacustris]